MATKSAAALTSGAEEAFKQKVLHLHKIRSQKKRRGNTAAAAAVTQELESLRKTTFVKEFILLKEEEQHQLNAKNHQQS